MSEKFLKLIDFYPQNLYLTYKGNKTFKTSIGGIFSIITIILIFTNAVLLGGDIYYREKPHTLEFEVSENHYPTTRFNYKRNFLAWQLTDFEEENFWDETAIQFIPTLNFGKYVDGKYKFREIFLEMVDCIEEYHRLNITLPMDEDAMEGFKCVKDFDIYLSGAYTEQHISYFFLTIRTCKNTTLEPDDNLNNEEEINTNLQLMKNMKNLNPTGYPTKENEYNDGELDLFNHLEKYLNKPKENEKVCKSQAEIEKIVDSMYLNFYYDKVKINAKSYKKPLTSTPNIDYYLLGNNFKKSNSYIFSNYVVETDPGIIFEDSFIDKSKIGFRQKNTDFNSKNPNDSILSQNEIYISNNVHILSRRYLKVQGIFANLGGFISLIMLIFRILSFPVLRKKLNLEIINELFDFDDKIEYDEKHKLNNIEDVLSKEKSESIKINKNPKDLNPDKEHNFSKEMDSKIYDCKKISIMRENENDLVFQKDDINNLKRINNENDYSNVKRGSREECSITNEKINNNTNSLIYLPNVINNLQNQNDQINKSSISKLSKDNENESCSSRDFNLNKEKKSEEKNEEEKSEEEKNETNSELSKKVENLMNMAVNKLVFSGMELLKSSYGLLCFDKKTKNKNEIYNMVVQDIDERTDYFELIRLSRKIKLLQFLVLNKTNFDCLSYLSNPIKTIDGFLHQNEQYAYMFNSNKDEKQKIIDIHDYFENKFKEGKDLNNIDEKIWSILHNKIKNLIKEN